MLQLRYLLHLTIESNFVSPPVSRVGLYSTHMSKLALKFYLFLLLPLQSFGGAQSIGVFAMPTEATYSVLKPGDVVTGDFYTPAGEAEVLPAAGRYLLWVLDAAFALEDRATIPAAEYNPAADEDATLYNTATELLPLFADLGGYLVFIEQAGLFPAPGATETLGERYPAYQVRLDYNANIPPEATASATTLSTYVAGLYLIEDGTVRYRFIGPGLWERWGVTDLVKEAAAAFLAGEEPALVPVTASPGATLPKDLSLEGPALIFRGGVEAADAPENGLSVQETETSGGTLTELTEARPGSGDRFLLEKLQPTLDLYGVRGVALVQEETPDLDKLSASFPGWTFVGVTTPEDRLRWLEVRSLVTSASGKVVAPFLITPSMDKLTEALSEALSRTGD